MVCPLCHSEDISPFYEDNIRTYQLCKTCTLVFVPEKFHLSNADEKSRYELHENDSEDPKYRIFLMKLATPLVELLNPGNVGLDFGSGPGPTLSKILTKMGFPTSDYDPYFCDNKELLKKRYNFITSTETFEHIRDMKGTFEKLLSMINPCGYIAIMTQMYDEKDFKKWHYTRDDTHIRFFSRDTFKWLSERYDMELKLFGDSVAIFKLPAPISR